MELNTKSLTLAIVRWSSRAKIILSSAQTKWIDHRDPACGKMPVRCIRLSAQTRTTSEETAHRDVLNNLCDLFTAFQRTLNTAQSWIKFPIPYIRVWALLLIILDNPWSIWKNKSLFHFEDEKSPENKWPCPKAPRTRL